MVNVIINYLLASQFCPEDFSSERIYDHRIALFTSYPAYGISLAIFLYCLLYSSECKDSQRQSSVFIHSSGLLIRVSFFPSQLVRKKD
jgi:hypothetical protein